MPYGICPDHVKLKSLKAFMPVLNAYWVDGPATCVSFNHLSFHLLHEMYSKGVLWMFQKAVRDRRTYAVF